MNSQQGFGVWITGLPASGKSSITKALAAKLRERGIATIVLESDGLRRILTPTPSYSPEERDWFYRIMAELGRLVTMHGVNVIFDATAHKRSYRDGGRAIIPHFIEVFVDTPVETCKQRDPKGIYRRADSGDAQTVPGIQAAYEPPLAADVRIDGHAPPDAGAEAILRIVLEFHSL